MELTDSQKLEIESFRQLLRRVSGLPIEMVVIDPAKNRSNEKTAPKEETNIDNTQPIEMVVIDPSQQPPQSSKSSSDFRPKYKGCSTRYDKESDKYNNKPLDPEYYKQYYTKNNVLVECDGCGTHVSKLTLWRHKKSNRCKMAQLIKALSPSEIS